MSEFFLPLINLFTKLQRRNYPLGVSDYALVLEALSRGARVASREDLIFLCQSLWAKSSMEQHEIALELNRLLPKRLTVAELEALQAEERQKKEDAPLDIQTEKPRPQDSSEESTGGRVSQSADQKKRDEQELMKEAARKETARKEAGGKEGLKAGAVVSALGQIEAEEKIWSADARFDYIGSLPVTRRQMKRAWRYMRLTKRIGTPVELDVEATVEHTYRLGVFEKTILMPRRANLAQLLILADEGGSMLPFRRVTEPLMESASQSGLAKVSTFFFHDVINNTVYLDQSLTRSIEFERALNSAKWTGILVVSDAGAARGNYDEARIIETEKLMQRLKQATANIAWLNPTPVSRWEGATAGELLSRCGAMMFTLDRAGLDAAVDAARGRKR
jgi:uncharacterized protein